MDEPLSPIRHEDSAVAVAAGDGVQARSQRFLVLIERVAEQWARITPLVEWLVTNVGPSLEPRR